jgi:UDP-apiose/xylose synthase
LKVLLLGGGGFIGSNLVAHLLVNSEHTLTVVDNNDEKIADIEDRLGRFTFVRADVRHNEDKLDELVQWADVVLDMIAYANPSIYISRPLDVVNLNFFQNMELINRCVKYKKRLIQFSTSEVYGLSEGRREPFSEEESNLVMGPIKNQRWIYASAKELLERIIYAHGQENGLDFTIIRPFNFVGPKIDYLVAAGVVGGPRVFSHFMSALLADGPMRLVDGGQAFRSYTHIDDASRAIQLIIDNAETCHNDIINIGSPQNGATVRELAQLMLDLYEELTGQASGAYVEEIPGIAFYGEGYEDCDWRIPDTHRINALGWDPRLDLRETFRRTMAWYLDRIAAGGELPSYLRPEAFT